MVTPSLRDKTEQLRHLVLEALKSLELSSVGDEGDFELNYSNFIKKRVDLSKHLGNIMMNRTKIDAFG